MKKFISVFLGIFLVGCVYSVGSPLAFPKIECSNPKNFSKSQKDNLIYAYTFGAKQGMGYIMAAIAWQESCAGAYMMNFSDPSAGLYHAHIPVVIKYYSNYKDSDFTRNVMGQMLIDDKDFASQIALSTLLYWYNYHKKNLKNTIKSYNKGFKWEKDKTSNVLAESYYKSITKKIALLQSYLPPHLALSQNKNQITAQSNSKSLPLAKSSATKPTTTKSNATNVAKLSAKNQAIANSFHNRQTQRQSAKTTQQNTQAESNHQTSSESTSKSTLESKPESILDSTLDSNSNSTSPTTQDFIDIPANQPQNQHFDESAESKMDFEDYHLIFEGY
ncbi:hypothetical protein [Helicobacter fennelliae]|uniref:Transglycosylase SLT domain-containing protein n=2 Tax=Helicobacter fennelliae TaxID=215 RepID=T1DWW7_9HELI|nr:hypothetical protein [Helicobacter fennelliae]GAD19988.1 hypothetical protein HFN_1232 [Helicobacter fennelliae MRY12-0050]SQB99476.1 Uncharacterised protein [Helicobacter fennelliae]STP07570.1 Uncharacterised protein [Helicobacter fennelliae]